MAGEKMIFEANACIEQVLPSVTIRKLTDEEMAVSPAFAQEFTKGLTNCSVVHLVPGAHYLQEDHPQTIGANIRQWLTDLGVANQTAV
jgi:hypothetical protein